MVAVTKAAPKAIQVLVCSGDNMDCHWGTLGGTAGHSQSINQSINLLTFYIDITQHEAGIFYHVWR